MEPERFVYQRVVALTAVAVGQPGHRTFYFVAGDGESWVRVWLEKEQLQSLSEVLEEMLDTIAEGGNHPFLEDDDRLPEILFEPDRSPVAEFKLSQLAIGYDDARDRIGLFIYGPEAQTDSPTVVCWITRLEARTLGERIDDVCTAGRPICDLCGGPINPEGHVCPKSNGHSRSIH